MKHSILRFILHYSLILLLLVHTRTSKFLSKDVKKLLLTSFCQFLFFFFASFRHLPMPTMNFNSSDISSFIYRSPFSSYLLTRFFAFFYFFFTEISQFLGSQHTNTDTKQYSWCLFSSSFKKKNTRISNISSFIFSHHLPSTINYLKCLQKYGYSAMDLWYGILDLNIKKAWLEPLKAIRENSIKAVMFTVEVPKRLKTFLLENFQTWTKFSFFLALFFLSFSLSLAWKSCHINGRERGKNLELVFIDFFKFNLN